MCQSEDETKIIHEENEKKMVVKFNWKTHKSEISRASDKHQTRRLIFRSHNKLLTRLLILLRSRSTGGEMMIVKFTMSENCYDIFSYDIKWLLIFRRAHMEKHRARRNWISKKWKKWMKCGSCWGENEADSGQRSSEWNWRRKAETSSSTRWLVKLPREDRKFS